jgi:predicted HTH transcriptional regulator
VITITNAARSQLTKLKGDALMTPERLRELLSQGEGWDVEFKECADALSNSVFETVCSFSNRYGGHLLLGVSDEGKVLGVNRSAAIGVQNISVRSWIARERFCKNRWFTQSAH